MTMKLHRTPATLLATILVAASSAPVGLARADIFPPAGMNPSASNATLPQARTNLGAAAGNGANVVADYGADPTGVADSTNAFINAVAAACNNASPVFQAKEVFVPSGLYLVSNKIPVTNGCWIHGSHALAGGKNAGGAVLRASGLGGKDLFQFRGFGQLKITDLRFDTTGGYQTGGASYCRVQAGGTNYALNDTITLTGGTFTTATVLKVTALSGTAVTGCVITTPGTYSVAPSPVAAVAQGSSSGSGTGATFNMVYANAAAITVSGPATTLSADAASGATSLTVAAIAGFSNGDAISIEQDNGVYFSTTISGAPSGNTIILAAGLTFKSSVNHPVYDLYASNPLIDNVLCVGYWDCLRVDNAAYVTVRNFSALDYGHDGIIKTSGAQPDGGGDRYQLLAWDQNRGTSNAGIEFLAGGDVAVSEKSKFLGSNYSVLLNGFFGPTGTLLVQGSSLEQSKICAIRLHQSISTIEYGNVAITGNELSHLAGATSSQNFCIDAGTPNTAPKWLRNINFVGNHSNDAVTAAVSSINIQDGDNIVVAGNALNNNNTAGPTGIAIGGAATHVLEYGNEIVGFTSGKYGTMLDSSFDTITLRGGMQSLFNSGSLQTGYTCDNADAAGSGCQIKTTQNGTTLHTLASQYQSGSWHFNLTVGGGTSYIQRWRADGKVVFSNLANVDVDANALVAVNGSLGLMGATSGTLRLAAPATAGTNLITLPGGTTDFSATGGASQVVKQTSAGGALTVAQLATSDLGDIGTFNLNTTGTAQFKVKESTKTTNYSVLSTDSGTYFDNTGAAGEVDFSLPTYAAGLRYCFTTTAAQILKVIAPASAKIAIGTTNSATAGNVTASAVYSAVCIFATSVSNQWAADRTTGSWTVN